MTKNSASKGRHLPSVEFTMVNPANGRVFILTNDIGHRRVTMMGGTPEALVGPVIREFGDRDSLRDFVDARLEKAEYDGFVTV